MNVPDLVNGLFEGVGSIAVWRCVMATMKDKSVRGVRALPILFFAAWGYWNMYYYPHLGQYLSFAGGVSITLGNTVWGSLLLRYRKGENA